MGDSGPVGIHHDNESDEIVSDEEDAIVSDEEDEIFSDEEDLGHRNSDEQIEITRRTEDGDSKDPNNYENRHQQHGTPTEAHAGEGHEENITNNLVSILVRLSGSIGNIANSTTTSIASIKSSLTTVSLTSSGLLFSVTRQLNSVFEILSKLTGSYKAIVTELDDSLPSIFDTIIIASKSLTSGIGAQASTAVAKYVEDIHGYVSDLLSIIKARGVSKELNVKEIEDLVKVIARSVQFLTSTVAAVTSSVSAAMSNVAKEALEAAIAIEFILSATLYVVEWAVPLASIILLSTTNSKILSDTTVAISGTLELVSTITATISDSLNGSLSNTVTSIAKSVSKLDATANSLFSKVTDVVANIVGSKEEIPSSSSKSIEGSSIVNGSEGNVLQILSGSTGPLQSISSTLSSSLSHFSSFLKEITTSDFVILKSIGSILTLIIHSITSVSGSASQILAPISSSLSTVFDMLFKIVSTLVVLGDVKATLTKSLSDISSALNSLIDAINRCSGNLSVLDDPVKNVAKTVQILVSTLFGIFDAAANATADISDNIAEAILALPYVVSTIIIVVQHVLGASIATMLVKFGSLNSSQQLLTFSISTILESITSITADITTSVLAHDYNPIGLISNLLSSVSSFNSKATSSLSVISGVRVNINVSFGVNRQEL